MDRSHQLWPQVGLPPRPFFIERFMKNQYFCLQPVPPCAWRVPCVCLAPGLRLVCAWRPSSLSAPGALRVYENVPGCTRMYQIGPDFTRLYQNVSHCTGVGSDPDCIRVYQIVPDWCPEHPGFCQSEAECTRMSFQFLLQSTWYIFC